MSNLEQSRTDNDLHQSLNTSLISNNEEVKGENESLLSNIYKKTMDFMSSK